MATANRATILVLAAFLAACASVGKDDRIRTLVVRFEEGAHERLLSVEPLALVERGAPFDLRFEDYGDFKGRVTMGGSGRRNLMYVGSGDEAAFRKLAALASPWHPARVTAAAKEAGVTPSDRAGYWSPNGPDSRLAAGMIVAVRDREDATQATALLLVGSNGPGVLTLRIAQRGTP